MMKAIETNYNGIRFRSRLEARTAVLLDAFGIIYIYEPEGFVFDDGTTYLPDFYLPEQFAFLECKGVMGEKDMHKIEMLARESGNPVVIVDSDLRITIMDSAWDRFEKKDICEICDALLIKCGRCGCKYFMRYAFQNERYCGNLSCPRCTKNSKYIYSTFLHDKCSAQLEPFKKAKSARFEFGEAGV